MTPADRERLAEKLRLRLNNLALYIGIWCPHGMDSSRVADYHLAESMRTELREAQAFLTDLLAALSETEQEAERERDEARADAAKTLAQLRWERDLAKRRLAALAARARDAERCLKRLASTQTFTTALDLDHSKASALAAELRARGEYASAYFAAHPDTDA